MLSFDFTGLNQWQTIGLIIDYSIKIVAWLCPGRQAAILVYRLVARNFGASLYRVATISAHGVAVY